MARTLLIPALVLVLLATAAPAGAAPVEIGIGEQKASMFDSRFLKRLHLRHARYLAPWDALQDPEELAKLDTWIEGAAAARMRPLIGFGQSRRSHRGARVLPSARRFARAFRGFRERYPHVRDWLVWNEANHPSTRTGRRPERAAEYFDAVARECPGCRVVAADVLDTSGMEEWVQAFLHHARAKPRIWGLHNYVDTNHRDDRGTRALLALTRGQVWFTETGGLVLRRQYKHKRLTHVYRYGVRHAALGTRHALRLACISPRVRRVYLYHWQAPLRVTNWDSGLLGPFGRPRPAYEVLRRHVRRNGPVVRC